MLNCAECELRDSFIVKNLKHSLLIAGKRIAELENENSEKISLSEFNHLKAKLENECLISEERLSKVQQLVDKYEKLESIIKAYESCFNFIYSKGQEFSNSIFEEKNFFDDECSNQNEIIGVRFPSIINKSPNELCNAFIFMFDKIDEHFKNNNSKLNSKIKNLMEFNENKINNLSLMHEAELNVLKQNLAIKIKDESKLEQDNAELKQDLNLSKINLKILDDKTTELKSEFNSLAKEYDNIHNLLIREKIEKDELLEKLKKAELEAQNYLEANCLLEKSIDALNREYEKLTVINRENKDTHEKELHEKDVFIENLKQDYEEQIRKIGNDIRSYIDKESVLTEAYERLSKEMAVIEEYSNRKFDELESKYNNKKVETERLMYELNSLKSELAENKPLDTNIEIKVSLLNKPRKIDVCDSNSTVMEIESAKERNNQFIGSNLVDADDVTHLKNGNADQTSQNREFTKETLFYDAKDDNDIIDCVNSSSKNLKIDEDNKMKNSKNYNLKNVAKHHTESTITLRSGKVIRPRSTGANYNETRPDKDSI